MSPHIAALIFALFSTGCARLLLSHSFSLGVRGIYTSAATAIALFGMTGEPATVLLGGLVILLVAAPAKKSERLALFLIVIPALPVTLEWLISIPGVNALFNLTWAKVCVIGLLLPCLTGSYSGKDRLTTVDVALFVYAIATALVVASVQNTTSGLRFFFDQLLLVVIPYLAARRSIQTSKDLELVMSAFVLAAVVLACAAMIAAIKHWDFYRLYEPASVFTIPEFRGGIMRINLTAGTHSLGFHCAAAILMIEALKSRAAFQFRSALLVQCLLLLCIYVTQSRGAMGGLAVGLLVMALIRTPNAALRRSLWCLSVVGGAFIAHLILSADFAKNDPYGTFKYRQELLASALQFIINNPWLGDFDFYRRLEFQHLVQGQGIIDITNLYLLAPLRYGVPIAMLLFASIGASLPRLMFGIERSVRSVASARTGGPARGSPAMARARPRPIGSSGAMPSAAEQGSTPQEGLVEKAVIAGATAGWFFLVATTSDTGLIMHLGLTLAAIGAAILRPDFKWS